MIKIFKKGISFLIAFALLVGMMPSTVFAAVDSTGRPKDVNNELVLSIYIGDGFPGEPAVYGTSDYKNFDSSFKVKSGATFASSAKNQLDWTKIQNDIVQGTSSGSTSVWGVYDANGTKDYFLNNATIVQPENEAKMIRAIKTNLSNKSDAEVLQQYEIVWYVIKLQHSSGWFGATEWHIDGVIKEKAKISINYYGNGNTSGAAPLGTASHTAGDSYTVLDKNTMVKKINGVEVAFLGWSAKADGTGEEAGFYQPGEVINPTESISLYAMWDTTTQYTATVYTYLDGVLTKDTDIHGEDWDLHLSTDEVHYYQLQEVSPGVYNTKITGNGKFHLYNKEADGTYVQASNSQLTIYNQDGFLEVHHYSVSYDPNGGTFVTAPEQHNYRYGQKVTAITDIPTREGYRFIGWECGNGNIIQPGDVVTESITAKTILKAVWEKTVSVTINVTINHDGGGGHDQMSTKDDVTVALAKKADSSSPYLETGDVLNLSNTNYTGFTYTPTYGTDNSEAEIKTTKYTSKGATYTNMPGGDAEYTVVASKSGYETNITHTKDTNGNWIIDVVMTYKPTNFDLDFTVTVDETVKEQYIPTAAIVKVLFWSTDRNQWEVITQHEGGEPGVRVDIDSATRIGSGSYPVWKYESASNNPYGYRAMVSSFIYPDGTIVPTSEKVAAVSWTDNAYVATMDDVTDGQKYGTLNGAYFEDASGAQKGNLNVNITIDLHDVTFDAKGGTVNGYNKQVVADQYKIPSFSGYVPTRNGGYIFDGWYTDADYKTPAVEGADLTKSITLYAKWIEPLTISGTVLVSGTYKQDGKTVYVHDVDRATEAIVVLQEIRDGKLYEVDSETVFFGTYSETGSADYAFTGIENKGKDYQINILLLNYVTTYDNESDNGTSYSDTEYTAVFGNDNIADIDVHLDFSAPAYDQLLNVDATAIGEGFRPSKVLSEVIYRDTGDNKPYNVISQHTVTPYGVEIGLIDGIGKDSQSVWQWHTNGTVYDYQMNVTAVDGTQYNSDTAPFYIVYDTPTHWNVSTNSPSGELKATLIPNKYIVTFDLNAGEDIVTGMDNYLQEDGSYSMEHKWSYATPFDVEPGRTNYVFLGWEADVENAYNGNEINAGVAQNVTLTAKWQKITYTVETVASPAEGGTTSGDGTYDVETKATVKATANANYKFAGWYENDAKVSDDAEYAFAVTENRTLTAKFEKITYTVTTVASPSEGGTTNGDGTYDSGNEVTVKAAAKADYQFAGWYENDAKVSDNVEYAFTVTGNHNLTAKFEKITYTVTTVASPSEGGTTSGDGTYDVGTEVTVKATTNTDYQFAGWYEDDAKVSDNVEYTFTVTGNHNLTAKFEKDVPVVVTYTVTTKIQGNGTVTGGGVFEDGAKITLSAVADEGNVFIGWRGENGELITVNKEFEHTVNADVTFTAYFEKNSAYKNDYAYIFGYNDTEMGAEGTLLRSEVSVMVHRLVKQNGMLGKFRYNSANPSFADIQGEWFQSGIEFMHHKGAFNVEEGGNVQPYVAVTRGEAFKIVALGLGFTSDTTLSHAGYANLLYELGYIVGDGSGNLDVESTITRAEFCTMYNRIIGRENALLVDGDGNEITAETYGFTDLNSGKWYYEAMLRATSAYDDDGYVDVAKRGIRNNLDDYGN